MTLPSPGQQLKANSLKTDKLTIKELQAFMQKNGLSNKEFADILGVTIQAVTLWLEGQRDFSITNTRLIRMFIKYPTLLREFGR